MFDKALDLFSCRFKHLIRERRALVTLLSFPVVVAVVMGVLSNNDDRAKLLGLFVLLPVSALVIAALTSIEGLVPRSSALKGLNSASGFAEVLFGSAVLAVQSVAYMLVVLLIGEGSAPGIGILIATWCVSSAIYFGVNRLAKLA